MSPRVSLVSTDNLHYKQGVEFESSGKEKPGEGLMKNGSCIFLTFQYKIVKQIEVTSYS